MACDVSWKSRLSTLNDENVLLKTQVNVVVQERENIKLEFQKLFNSIKETRTQHQKEIKIKTIEKGNNVNTEFDKSETLGTLLCVTPLPKNIAVKAKKVSNTKVNADRCSHLNFGTINQLTSKDLVDGTPKFKYNKDYLCSAYEQGKSTKASLLPKLVPSTESKLELIHMDLYGPMRVASINGKEYILVIVDDYSRYTWVYFLCTKDEAPDRIINFMNQVQRNLKAQILKIRTDNEAEFKNEKLRSLCYPTNNHDDLGKMKPKAEIGIFIGYSESSRGFQIYNCRTKKILETIHVKFDELTTIASKCNNLGLGLKCSNFQESLDDINKISSQQDLDNLFGPLYEEYYASSTSEVTNYFAINTLDVEDIPSPSAIIVKDSDAPHIVTSLEEPITQESSILILETHYNEQPQEDITKLDGNTIMYSFKNSKIEQAESSSNYQDPSNKHELYQEHRYTNKWTKNHSIE
nr:retrovirus-related Pol polyprotein from transposon TNT 1-94 [Tanacetum cinerariifolium]